MLVELRKTLVALERVTALDGGNAGMLPFGIAPIDDALGGGLARGALHEIAATGESQIAAASGGRFSYMGGAMPRPILTRFVIRVPSACMLAAEM
jgi:hypothetical protein